MSKVETPSQSPKLYGRLLWLASVAASALTIPYSIAFLRQTGDKPSLESLRSQIAEGQAETAILSMLLIALGLACGKSVGLGWPPLLGWGKGPENSRQMRSAQDGGDPQRSCCRIRLCLYGRDPAVGEHRPRNESAAVVDIASGVDRRRSQRRDLVSPRYDDLLRLDRGQAH